MLFVVGGKSMATGVELSEVRINIAPTPVSNALQNYLK